MSTCPLSAVTLNFFNFPPKPTDHTACVSSCPRTYIHLGSGKKINISVQVAAPASVIIHIICAEPVLRVTQYKATKAPAQKGKSKNASSILEIFKRIFISIVPRFILEV